MKRIYTIKLTDHYIYLYHHKQQEIIKKPIARNIINGLKIYHVKKTIKVLEQLLNNLKPKTLLRLKINFLISKNWSPAEVFLIDYVAKSLNNVKHCLLFEEDLINDKKAIIIWDDYLNIISKKMVVNLQELLKNKENIFNDQHILIGLSDKFDYYQEELNKAFKIPVLTYENSDRILFERVQ